MMCFEMVLMEMIMMVLMDMMMMVLMEMMCDDKWVITMT